MILTGSYDCCLKLWDIRKIYQEVEELNTGRQIWDVKFNEQQGLYKFAIAGVYDGYQFGQEINKQAPFSLGNIKIDLFLEHKDICYASEFVFSKEGVADKVLTSSFYDSNLKLVEIKSN